jgi:hypothetical protein
VYDQQAWESLIGSEAFSNTKSNLKSEKEKNEMINLQRNQAPTETNVKRGVQFLKPQHVTNPTAPLKAKIYKVTTDKPDGFGNPVIVYFQVGTQKYSKSFKLTSDNLAALVELHGADETKWIGKPVSIGKSVSEDGERLTFTK